ncbi:MAG: YfhO family protein [Clostridia bacterium]|nr:YfhO family protein [Clostridia bacterium]
MTESPALPTAELPVQNKKRSAWGRLTAYLMPRRYLLLCFFVPALLLLFLYAVRGVFPFGEGSVLVLDLNGQYVYFFQGLRRAVLGGEGLVYTFSRTLSGEFMGIFAYYLASPFSWLVLLFPEAHITEALLLMFLLKTGSCGLTFGIYIDKTRERRPTETVMFSVMYALCTYAVVMQHNTMWIDNLILLPLVTLGIESVIREKKYKLFVVSLALAILSNFYIGYMMCIYVILYFFYAYFSRSEAERNLLGEKHHFLRSSLRMLALGLLALAIAAVIILPAYTSLQFGKSTFSKTVFDFEANADFLDLTAKLFFGSYDTVRPDGLPMLFTGTLTLLLVPLYFFAPHIRTREKVASVLFIAVFVISMSIPALDIVWHGLQNPNWLNFRYAFMLCFFFVVLAFKAMERIREIGYRRVAVTGAALVLVLFVLQKFDLSNFQDFPGVWVSLAFVVLYVLLLRAVTHRDEMINRTGATILALAVIMEMGFSGAYDLYALDKDVIFSGRTGYVTFMERIQPAVDYVLENDTSFYRFEKTVHRKSNDNMALGIRGLSGSTSTLNASAIGFLRNMGMRSRSHVSQYNGSTIALDALTGIKYVIAERQTAMPADYVAIKTFPNEEDEKKDLIVYENPYAFSIAFGVSPDVRLLDEENETIYDSVTGEVTGTRSVFESYLTPFERTNALLAAMLGDTEVPAPYHKATIDTTTNQGLRLLNVVDHRGYAISDGASEGSITYQITVTSEDELFLYMASGYPRECKVYVNGASVGMSGGSDSTHVFPIGRFEVGEQIKVKLVLQDKNLYLRTGADLFFYLDEAACTEQLREIGSSSQFEISEYTSTYFKGTINVEEGREAILTTLPYDSGWKVYADGEKIETTKALSAFVSFDLTPGEHELELRYVPDCLVIGGACSIAGTLGFAALCTVDFFRRRKAGEGDLPVLAWADEAPADGPDGKAACDEKETTAPEETSGGEEDNV